MTEKYRNTPKGRIAPNGYRLCDPLPEGQILTDTEKKTWVVGKPIGLGGFGEIYLCYEKNSSTEYVMKLDNPTGPLFVEINFFLRACQKTAINAFMEKRKLSFLGIPRFIAIGTHQSPKGGYRFLIMDRLGEELQTVLETKQLSIPVTCRIASRIIDALEYIHDQGYIHADIKAQNILRSSVDTPIKRKKRTSSDFENADEDDKYFLIDYGLAEKYTLQGVHKPYEFDKRKANNGTCEFRSRDAHIGVISRRSDIESLGFNLILWFYGRHPWANVLKDADKVLEKKNWAMKNINKFLDEAFSDMPVNDSDSTTSSKTPKSKAKAPEKKRIPIRRTVPKGFNCFFEEINTMSHDACPNYVKFKKILENIAKLNPSNSPLNGTAKVSRLNTPKQGKGPSKASVNSHLNCKMSSGEDTEIEDFVDGVSKTAKSKATPLKTPGTKSAKANKIKSKPASNRVTRNRKIEISENSDTDEEKEPPQLGKTRYSTTLMMSDDSPLFGPDDSFSCDSMPAKSPRRKETAKTNDETNRRPNTCRIYIDNKRCRPRQSYDQDDFDMDELLPAFDSRSSSTKSSSLENVPNGKCTQSSTRTTNTAKPKQNGLKKVAPSNGLTPSNSVNSSVSTPRSSRKTGATATTIPTPAMIAMRKTGGGGGGGAPTFVAETAAMQRIRERMQQKKTVTGKK